MLTWFHRSVTLFVFGVPVMQTRYLKYFLILARLFDRSDVWCLNAVDSSIIRQSNFSKNFGGCFASHLTASWFVM